MTLKLNTDNSVQRKTTEHQQVTAVWRNGGCSASYDSFVDGKQTGNQTCNQTCSASYDSFVDGKQTGNQTCNQTCSASYDSFVVGSSAALRLNFCAKNLPLRQAAKRYSQC